MLAEEAFGKGLKLAIFKSGRGRRPSNLGGQVENMAELNDEELVIQRRREQMLKLVAKGFYNELINYGVEREEILKVASHLLDNLMAQEKKPGAGVEYYNKLFTLASVTDEWQTSRQLTVQHVTLRPLDEVTIAKLVRWLKNPAIHESFVTAFPKTPAKLRKYFGEPTRDYFGIHYEGVPVGIVGGENIDRASGKMEMKKLVGEQGLHGKGIGKRATFGFLYHAFMILNLHKVYLHSRDINIRNLNLNSRFGFQLEGVFFEDIQMEGKKQDIVRMALFKPQWLEIFTASS